jgi:hypothetical protein
MIAFSASLSSLLEAPVLSCFHDSLDAVRAVCLAFYIVPVHHCPAQPRPQSPRSSGRRWPLSRGSPYLSSFKEWLNCMSRPRGSSPQDLAWRAQQVHLERSDQKPDPENRVIKFLVDPPQVRRGKQSLCIFAQNQFQFLNIERCFRSETNHSPKL